MGNIISWVCPYCNYSSTIRKDDLFEGYVIFKQYDNDGNIVDKNARLSWHSVRCPNPNCKQLTLRIALNNCTYSSSSGFKIGSTIYSRYLLPQSRARKFPDYIPKVILDDYNEACMIVALSPKASASLSRRCIQGIIRDFWNVKAGRLIDEIEQIKDKTDQLTWNAIDSVRKVGNIGAHMEKDVNVIVDVEPNEAVLLIELIEILLKDWYIATEEKKKRLEEIKFIADKKENERKK